MAIGVPPRKAEPIQEKSDKMLYTLARLAFNAGVMAQADFKQQGIHPDERSEFIGSRFDKFIRSQGIKHE